MYGRKCTAWLTIAAAGLFAFAGCTQEPAWSKVNRKIIKEQGVQERVRKDIPETKVVSNLEEVRARNGKLIIVCSEGDSKIASIADYS